MRSPGNLNISLEHLSGATVVSVAGEIDLATASELQARLIDAGRGRPAVIADLREVTYFDMSGVRAIEAAARTLGAQGGRLTLANPSPLIRRIFDLVAREIPVALFGSVEEAAAHLREAYQHSD